MNKNDIKTKWGQYADTDKLVDDIMFLLTKYNHRNSEHGVCCILEQFFTKKEALIKLLQKHDSYAGDLRIILDEQLERRCNSRDVNYWIDTFPSNVKAHECIKKRTDAHNKTFGDYLKIGKHKVSVADFDDVDFLSAALIRSESLQGFTHDGFTKESDRKYNEFVAAIACFRDMTSSTVPEEIAEYLADYKIHNGTKTSRAFNKICNQFEVDRAPSYNKEFAKYADMMSGLKRDIKFFISVNPLDYLTMSFGVNWASCHTIDKRNVRHMDNSYSGAYCGGTMSYMLDSTSIVTYVHNTMPENYEDGKVYRNMFHLGGDGALLQGRVYPQGNDGCTDLYKEFRFIMQKEMAKVLELDSNKWTKRSQVSNIESTGCHYRDYNHFDDCNISYPSERPQCQHQTISVGSYRVCPHCGESADNLDSGYLSHSSCDVN